MKASIYLCCCVLFVLLFSCKQQFIRPVDEAETAVENNILPAPPPTWQENWFEHDQVLQRIFYNDRIAVYFDNDVDTVQTAWMFPFIDTVWTYTRSVYGDFGTSDTTNRLFAIFHTDKYGGGHPFMYYDANRLYRNGIDIGSGADAWINQTNWETNTIIHEVAHIVEMAGKGVKNSPAHWSIWGDSKWAEIFVYDVYKHTNMTAKMNDAYQDFYNTTDDFPRANTAWFKNWFLPIYEQFDEASVLNAYFEALASTFPKQPYPVIGQEYTRELNFGEFIHFWSAASGVNLSTRARLAFGPNDRNGTSWLTQFTQAQSVFGSLSYAAADPFFGQDLSQQTAVSVSVENSGGPMAVEGSGKLNDFDLHSKFFANGFTPGFWIQQEAASPVIANAYLISSANDAPNRDPKSWTLQGSNDQQNWTALDTRQGETFDSRRSFKVYDFNNATAYRYYRLQISETLNSTDIQLAEWRLMKK